MTTSFLDFLRRHHPDDKENFEVAALHFNMYEEIALIWEEKAVALMTKACQLVKQTSTEGLVTNITSDCFSQVNLAMDAWKSAAEHHMQVTIIFQNKIPGPKSVRRGWARVFKLQKY